MSEKRCRYVGGSQSGVDLSIPYADGDYVHVHVPHGGDLPAKTPDGRTIPADYVKGLLEQADNWSAEPAGKSDTAKAEKDGDK